jgi:Uncharacterized conserved protein
MPNAKAKAAVLLEAIHLYVAAEPYALDMTDASMDKFGFDTEEPSDITRDRWVRAQRDLITTTLDYNLQTVAGLVDDGRIDLSPSYQRRDRWDGKRKSLLMESFLMNVPLPPVFLNEDEYGKYSIIDGKQRLTTITEFLTDKFELSGLTVFQEANGLRFSQLDSALRSVLQTRASIRAIILLRMSDPLIKFHVFQRLNTGGVRLNAQEVRNVTFAGEFNDRLVEASTYLPFATLLGLSGKPETSNLWQQMRDVELVLRYLTLTESWQDFSGSLGGAMNKFMAEYMHAETSAQVQKIQAFTDAVDKVQVAFGPSAFRRVRGESLNPGRQVLATLYDAQMVAVEEYEFAALAANSRQIQAGMLALQSSDEFKNSIGAQTNTPKYVATRILMTHNMLAKAIAG